MKLKSLLFHVKGIGMIKVMNKTISKTRRRKTFCNTSASSFQAQNLHFIAVLCLQDYSRASCWLMLHFSLRKKDKICAGFRIYLYRKFVKAADESCSKVEVGEKESCFRSASKLVKGDCRCVIFSCLVGTAIPVYLIKLQQRPKQPGA